MVKISLKKESRVKKQKQKQKQSQKVVVNIGTNVLKPKRRRKATGPIEKKAVNKQQPSNVYIPQSLPISQSSQPPNSMSEFVKYLKESEKQKEVAQEKEKKKSNDLEKEKKEENRSEVLTRDEVQDNFSVVFPSSNISSLTTSGTSTPLLSRPINQNSLFEALSREADLRSENPNSGKISLSSSDSNPLLSSVSSTSLVSGASKQTLDDILQNTVVTAVEDPVIDQVLEELPENQIIVYGPQRAGQTATATQKGTAPNPIDGTIPPFLRPMNNPLPAVSLKDIIGPLSESQAERARQARIDKFDKKKPLLAIEDAVLPEFTKEELENYKKYFQQVEKNDESQNLQEQEDTPELVAFKDRLKGMLNKDMGNLLIKNHIKGPNGKNYTVNQTGVNLGSVRVPKQRLSEALISAFNEGKITQ